MNLPPEKHAGDPDPPSPGEPAPVAPPPAVSFDDRNHNEVNAEQEKRQSSSSSDSDSDEEDFFQLESTELSGPSAKPPRTPIFVDNETSLSAKYLSRKPPQPARYDVPDPNRIPMSVFARNTATASPKEWSVASNESLFSIQLGNSSFSREQGMLLMGRSEDLGNVMSGPLEYPPPRPPPARVAVEGKAKMVDMDEVKEEDEDEEAMKEKTAGYPLLDSISRQSDCSSTTSIGSFAFPVLVREGKCESIKVLSKQYSEQQPSPPLINHPLNAPPTKPMPGLASSKRRCFPCFCWCQLCC